MKTVILIDDEPWARQQLKNDFPLEAWGFQIVGEAANGQEALRLCELMSPDIALIDITMPVMDGIALLKNIRTRYPRIRCIMLTAHREFAYARQALQEGAVGYILKTPDNSDELERSLKRAADELAKESRVHQNELSRQTLVQNYQYPLRRDLWQQILTGVLRSEREIAERARSMDIYLEGKHYALLVCQADRLWQLLAAYSEKDRALLEFSMLEIVRESLSSDLGQPFELFPQSFGRFCLLIKADASFDPERTPYQAFVSRLYKTFSHPLRQYMDVAFAVGVSSPFSTLEHIRSEFEAAFKRLDYRFYQDTPRPIFADALVPFQDLQPHQWEHLSDRWRDCMLHLQPDTFRSYIAFVRNRLVTYMPRSEKVLGWLSSLYSQLPDDTHTDIRREWPDFAKMPTLTDALAALSGWIEFGKRQQQQQNGDRVEIAKVKIFIREHLNEELSLDRIAAQVPLSPSHLGYLFKKELGLTVFDYVTAQRIALAKQYLITGEYRNYELAIKVGFPNYSYFSTLFKKQTGMSPNEFKATHR